MKLPDGSDGSRAKQKAVRLSVRSAAIQPCARKKSLARYFFKQRPASRVKKKESANPARPSQRRRLRHAAAILEAAGR
jgi:hypothetical protein